jgi:hypothetical protein
MPVSRDVPPDRPRLDSSTIWGRTTRTPEPVELENGPYDRAQVQVRAFVRAHPDQPGRGSVPLRKRAYAHQQVSL